MIMLKRVAFKPKNVPPFRQATQWTGSTMPTPRVAPVRIADTRATLVVPILKIEPVRSEEYRRYVASHACFDCNVFGFSQCAHENADKAKGMKVCDLRTFPLCGPRYGLPGCHFLFDAYVDRTRDECRELGRGWVERMQKIARNAGRKEFSV